MRVQMFGASDDQVLVRKIRDREAKEKDIRVEEKDGEKVLVAEETDEVLTDEDGEVVTKENMFDVESFMALRPVTLNVEDSLLVKFEFDSDLDSWTFTLQPYAETSEFRDYASVEELPEDWDISVTEVPEDVQGADPFGGLCLVLDVPDQETQDDPHGKIKDDYEEFSIARFD